MYTWLNTYTTSVYCHYCSTVCTMHMALYTLYNMALCTLYRQAEYEYPIIQLFQYQVTTLFTK